MKKILYLSFVAFVAATTLSSCNKKLKEELKELDKSVSDLEAKNADLESQLSTTNSNLTNTTNTVNNIDAALETNNPVSWTINATDNSVSPAVSFSKSYQAKLLLGSKDDYQYIDNQGSNIWEVYIEKYEDFNWNYYSYIGVFVDVTNNTLSSSYNNYIYGEHYSDYDGGTSFEAYANSGNVGQTITANTLSVNTSTGEVDINLSWSNTAGSTFGGNENGTIAFKGTCFIYN